MGYDKGEVYTRSLSCTGNVDDETGSWSKSRDNLEPVFVDDLTIYRLFYGAK